MGFRRSGIGSKNHDGDRFRSSTNIITQAEIAKGPKHETFANYVPHAILGFRWLFQFMRMQIEICLVVATMWLLCHHELWLKCIKSVPAEPLKPINRKFHPTLRIQSILCRTTTLTNMIDPNMCSPRSFEEISGPNVLAVSMHLC